MLQICFLALKMTVKHGWTNIEQIFNKYWTCVVCGCFALFCFKQSSMPNLVARWCRWCQWSFPGEPRRSRSWMFDQCAMPIHTWSLPASLSLSLLGTSFSPCFSVSRAGAVCATGPLGISGPRSASCNFSITFLTSHPSHRESLPTLPQEEKLPEEPRVLHRCSTAPENSREPVGHTLNIASTTRPETRGPNQVFHRHSLGTIIGLRWLDQSQLVWSGYKFVPFHINRLLLFFWFLLFVSILSADQRLLASWFIVFCLCLACS